MISHNNTVYTSTKKKNLAKPSKHLITSQVICMHKNNSSNKKKNIQSPNSDHLIKRQMFHKASKPELLSKTRQTQGRTRHNLS